MRAGLRRASRVTSTRMLRPAPSNPTTRPAGTSNGAGAPEPVIRSGPRIGGAAHDGRHPLAVAGHGDGCGLVAAGGEPGAGGVVGFNGDLELGELGGAPGEGEQVGVGGGGGQGLDDLAAVDHEVRAVGRDAGAAGPAPDRDPLLAVGRLEVSSGPSS